MILGMLTFLRLASANRARCETAFMQEITDWSPTDWACAMAGECGEACNLIKKLRRQGEFPTDLDKINIHELSAEQAVLVEQIGHELADVVIYADLLAQRLGIDLGAVTIEKFNIVSDRVRSEVRL